MEKVALNCGSLVPKNHKVFVAAGSLNEIVGYIGRLKAMYFNIESMMSSKLTMNARLTRIQEDFNAICKSILTTPKNQSKFKATRFDLSNIEELENAMKSMKTTPSTTLMPGNTPLDSELYIIRAKIQTLDRQLLNIHDAQVGIVLEDSIKKYLSTLIEYFGILISWSYKMV